MPKASDWDRIRHEFDLYRKTRAFRRHAVIAGSAVVLALAVLITRWALTSSGPAAAIKKAEAEPRSPVPRELRGSNEVAGDLNARIQRDERFALVVAVPTLDRSQGGGVMVQGQVASDGALADLRAIADKLKPGVPIDWQVLIVDPARR